MKLSAELLRQFDDPELGPDERRRRIELSKKFEEAGDYEAARASLGDLSRTARYTASRRRPRDEIAVGEILLRVGVLTGWIGSSEQIQGAQEEAKDLLSESLANFERLNEGGLAAEAQTELAYRYWREGAFDEARVILSEALRRLGEDDGERRSVTVLRRAIVRLQPNVTTTHCTYLD